MNENPELIPTANPVPDEGGPALKPCPKCNTFPAYLYNDLGNGTVYHSYYCRNKCRNGLIMSGVLGSELEARESWNARVDQLTNHVDVS